MQLLAVLGAVGALLLLNSPLSSPEIRLWIALCSLTIAGAACFLHAPCAAGSYAAIVLLGTIISHARLGWPGAVLGLAAAAMVVAVARVQAAAFQQSIRKARETEERARTAQAVLRSFEESGRKRTERARGGERGVGKWR